jgi:hypothetical protein
VRVLCCDALGDQLASREARRALGSERSSEGPEATPSAPALCGVDGRLPRQRQLTDRLP